MIAPRGIRAGIVIAAVLVRLQAPGQDHRRKQVHARTVPSLASNVVLELPTDLREGLYLVMVRMEGREPKSARVILQH